MCACVGAFPITKAPPIPRLCLYAVANVLRSSPLHEPLFSTQNKSKWQRDLESGFGKKSYWSAFLFFFCNISSYEHLCLTFKTFKPIYPLNLVGAVFFHHPLKAKQAKKGESQRARVLFVLVKWVGTVLVLVMTASADAVFKKHRFFFCLFRRIANRKASDETNAGQGSD